MSNATTGFNQSTYSSPTQRSSMPMNTYSYAMVSSVGWIPCALCKAWIPIVKDGVHEPPKHGICPYRKPSKCKTEPSFGCRWGFTA